MPQMLRGRRVTGDGMMRLHSKRRVDRSTFGRALLVGLMACVIAICSAGIASAQSAENDDDDAAPDTKFFRGVLKSLGLRRDGGEIEYRERSPLVLPPSRNLPSPETTSATAKNPAWPVDVELKRAKEAKANRPKYNINPEEVRPETPEQLNRNVPRRTSPGNAATATPANDGVGNPMSPTELGTKGIFKPLWGNREEYATFSNEPARSSLTEPPAGYRTPSPNQPYGVGKEKWKPGEYDRQQVHR